MEKLRMDHSLHMVVQEPRPLSASHLLFQRWLCQNGRGEHYPSGRPSGEMAMAMVIAANQPIQAIMGEQMKQHLADNGIINKLPT